MRPARFFRWRTGPLSLEQLLQTYYPPQLSNADSTLLVTRATASVLALLLMLLIGGCLMRK
jgi:hypothetical protein